MGGAPGHALYSHAIDLILDMQAIAAADPRSAPGSHIMNPVMATGPGILTKAVEHFMALYHTYTVDVAHEQPQLVGDLGVLPATAVAVGGYGTAHARKDQIFVKHMFEGTWKEATSGAW